MDPFVWLGNAVAFATAAVYAYVGVRVGLRPAKGDAALALRLFAVWWFGLAATSASSSLMRALAAAGVRDLALFVTFTHFHLLVVCVALWGLLYYLLFTVTGHRTVLIPLSVLYAGFFVSAQYALIAARPIGIDVSAWRASLVFESPPAGPIAAAIIFILVVPLIAGALAYFSLFFRVRDATQRYRIALVAWSIVAWFTSILLASLSGIDSEDWWNVGGRIIGIGASLTILAAYRPPRWVRDRFGVSPLGGGGDA